MNGIEKELDGIADVIRVNLNTQLGKEIGKRFEVTSAKTTIVLGASGEAVYRHVGMPDRKKIIALASS